jgi:RNA polymerase sigma-70 factor, ECF subfamily
MRRAQDGDSDAYSRLLEECASLLRAFIRVRLKNTEHTEDVVQETLISIHRGRHTYDPIRPFAPWMYAIAAHRVTDSQRKSLRIGKREVLDEAAMLSYFPTKTVNELGEKMASALQDLP